MRIPVAIPAGKLILRIRIVSYEGRNDQAVLFTLDLEPPGIVVPEGTFLNIEVADVKVPA